MTGFLAVLVAQVLDPLRWVLAAVAYVVIRKRQNFFWSSALAAFLVAFLVEAVVEVLSVTQRPFGEAIASVMTGALITGLIIWGFRLVSRYRARKAIAEYEKSPDPFYERNKH